MRDDKVPLWLAKFILSRYDRAVVFIAAVLLCVSFIWYFVIPRLSACEMEISSLKSFQQVQETRDIGFDRTDERMEVYFKDILSELREIRKLRR
jgi:hypothetical protein